MPLVARVALAGLLAALGAQFLLGYDSLAWLRPAAPASRFQALSDVGPFPSDPERTAALFRSSNPVKFDKSPAQQWKAVKRWTSLAALKADLCPRVPVLSDVCFCHPEGQGGTHCKARLYAVITCVCMCHRVHHVLLRHGRQFHEVRDLAAASLVCGVCVCASVWLCVLSVGVCSWPAVVSSVGSCVCSVPPPPRLPGLSWRAPYSLRDLPCAAVLDAMANASSQDTLYFSRPFASLDDSLLDFVSPLEPFADATKVRQPSRVFFVGVVTFWGGEGRVCVHACVCVRVCVYEREGGVSACVCVPVPPPPSSPPGALCSV